MSTGPIAIEAWGGEPFSVRVANLQAELNQKLTVLSCANLGVEVALPTVLTSASASSTAAAAATAVKYETQRAVNPMTGQPAEVDEGPEYPTATLRFAPNPPVHPARTITASVTLDDSFPHTAADGEEGLTKRLQDVQHEMGAMMMQMGIGGTDAVRIVRKEILGPADALLEWEVPVHPMLMMAGPAARGGMRSLDRVRVWNGVAVCTSVVRPCNVGDEALEARLSADAALMDKVMHTTLVVTASRLRLQESSVRRLQRLLVLAPPDLNLAANFPMPRRAVIADGRCHKPLENYNAPELEGTPLCRILDMQTEVSVALIMLPVKQLSDEEQQSSRMPLWARQLRANFSPSSRAGSGGGASGAVLVPGADGALLFTCKTAGEEHMKKELRTDTVPRLACAARPIPPRIGGNPNYFVAIVASKALGPEVFAALARSNGKKTSSDAVPTELQGLQFLAPELLAAIDSDHVCVTTAPLATAGAPLFATDGKEPTSSIIPSKLVAGGPPRCRYFCIQADGGRRLNNTNSSAAAPGSPKSASGSGLAANRSSSGSGVAGGADDAVPPPSEGFAQHAVNPLANEDAIELPMPLYGGGHERAFVVIVSRALWGGTAARMQGAAGIEFGQQETAVKTVMPTALDGTVEGLRRRAMMAGPGCQVTTKTHGCYDVVVAKPGGDRGPVFVHCATKRGDAASALTSTIVHL